MNQENQDELWSKAETLSELGEATAKWVEGTVSYHPCYRTDIDPETKRLTEQLTFLNRNGLVTTFSQPAEPLDNDGFSQRACVEGYATEEIARTFGALSLYTELLVLIYPPGVDEDGYQIPITIDGFRPFTWCGRAWGDEEYECFEEECSALAISALKSAWKVVAIDLQWGREWYLWDHLKKTLTLPLEKPYSVSPAHEGLDTDFVF